jgi:hypothetical protein
VQESRLKCSEGERLPEVKLKGVPASWVIAGELMGTGVDVRVQLSLKFKLTDKGWFRKEKVQPDPVMLARARAL